MLAFGKAPIIDKYDLSSLREIMSAAAPLSTEMAQLTSKRLGVSVRQGYGMTEFRYVETVELVIVLFVSLPRWRAVGMQIHSQCVCWQHKCF